MRALLLVALSMILAPTAPAEELRMIALNIERGYRPHAELREIGAILDNLGHADIWAFSEVSEGDLDVLINRLGENYKGITGTRGDDFLALAYDTETLELVADGEVFLTELNPGQRKPLWAQLRTIGTGTNFYVVANHFIRGDGDDPRRSDEARDLHSWARTHDPAIALGDFNLDFDVAYTDDERLAGEEQQSTAMSVLVKDDVWVWVRPDRLIPTQCNPAYDSVLDFAFVAGQARTWSRESRIIDTGCNDDALQPDHLPIELIINVP